MGTRAKFRCLEVTDLGFQKKVKLTVAYDPQGNGENAGFTKATPCGEIWMTIDNPAAAVQFEPTKHYYVDFSLAPD